MDSASPIALVGIPFEMASLLRCMASRHVRELPWGRLVHGGWRTSPIQVVVAEVSIGKVGAAMGVQGLIDMTEPRVVLNCGSAGALAPGLQAGDLALGDPMIAHDQGILLPRQGLPPSAREDGFVHGGSSLPTGRRRSFRPDSDLLARARAAGRRAGVGKLLTGPIVTGDQMIFQSGRKRWLHEAFAALAVENEGAAVAQVAHCHRLPWLVIRAISDDADDDAGFDYTPLLVFDEDGDGQGRPPRLKRLVAAWRQERSRPGTLMRVRRFRRGQRTAMAAVLALLDELLPDLWATPW